MNELFTTDFVLMAGNRVLRLTLILAATILSLRFFGVVIDRLFIPTAGNKSFYLEEKRARTLTGLLKSIIRYAIYFIATVLILQEFSINTTSIIAGAGVIGLALGVGAQSLVKDFITGFFIILEDQYAVGDYISCGEMAGTVEEMGFRVTKLRDANGILHIIPNGVISRVSNYTRGYMQAVINIPVPYEADIVKVLALLDEACSEIGRNMVEVLEQPKVLGVVDFKESDVIIRICAKTVPLEQAKVEAALRYKIMLLFEEARLPPLGAAVIAVKRGNSHDHPV